MLEYWHCSAWRPIVKFTLPAKYGEWSFQDTIKENVIFFLLKNTSTFGFRMVNNLKNISLKSYSCMPLNDIRPSFFLNEMVKKLHYLFIKWEKVVTLLIWHFFFSCLLIWPFTFLYFKSYHTALWRIYVPIFSLPWPIWATCCANPTCLPPLPKEWCGVMEMHTENILLDRHECTIEKEIQVTYIHVRSLWKDSCTISYEAITTKERLIMSLSYVGM